MKEYEEKKYAVWRENLETTLMTYLKKNLLVVASLPSSKTNSLKDEEKRPSVDDGNVTVSNTTLGSGRECF